MTIQQHARRIVSKLDPALREELAASPLDGLDQAGLRVAKLEHNDRPGRWCEGLSTTDSGIVLYLATPNSRRENFTLLHEYAHTLVEADDVAMVWLADQADDKASTEQLCNAVASMLLVPPEVIDDIVGPGPVRADHLLQLHRSTEASQSAIAVALARRLGTAGAVVLVDRASAAVAHAALVGELAIWPWKDQAIPDTHPLGRLQPGIHLQTQSWWATPWGERQNYYLDAVATTKRAYAILATTDIWHMDTFHGGDPVPERETRPGSTRACRCGYSGAMIGYPCPTCHANFCPKCNTCLCDARDAAARRCGRCTLFYAPSALVDGLCSDCR